ncbi:MAG: NUDIX hydrolase [Deltaproteobacteria bacterium]|nr:NUDIX hydrolase [Deltaproteobacteria bacterium]
MKKVEGMTRQRKYCCYCGGDILHKDIGGKPREYCPECDTVFYENPLPVASSILVNEDREVLLVKRRNEPYKGMWCLPIGFAETGEDVHDAALRELKEETGIVGEIVRLIDVDTINNYFYGSLAIVTYEVRKVGGDISPGDDAIDARYFPIIDLPSLAWLSNEKAVQIYIDYYKDTWAMLDSFKQLFPEISAKGEVPAPKGRAQKAFLSDVLIKIIDRDIGIISGMWAKGIKTGIPNLESHLNTLVGVNKGILKGVQVWLGHRQKVCFEDFIDTGRLLKELQIPLPDVLNAMALSRKAIWVHVLRKKILGSPLEIYTTLELNNRIILFYDKIAHYVSLGYFE